LELAEYMLGSLVGMKLRRDSTSIKDIVFYKPPQPLDQIQIGGIRRQVQQLDA